MCSRSRTTSPTTTTAGAVIPLRATSPITVPIVATSTSCAGFVPSCTIATGVSSSSPCRRSSATIAARFPIAIRKIVVALRLASFAKSSDDAPFAGSSCPVTTVNAVLCARCVTGIPVTHRAHNTAFTVVTGHEDPAKGASSLDFAKLANRKATTIFLMAMGNLAAIVAELRRHGLEDDTPVAIVHEGTKPAQEVLVATIGTVIGEVARSGITAPAVVVVGDVVREREHIRWFDAQPLFGKRVLVTRPAHQSDDVAMLLWEAGAEPILAPTIAIGPPDDLTAARDAATRVRDYAWVVFTSRNGVDAFFDRLGELGRDARAL